MSSLLSKRFSLVRGSRGSRICEQIPNNFFADIYRIVSSKSLESSNSNIEPPKASINVGPSVDNNASQGGKCC